MATIEEKKQFALREIAPYFINPEICGYDHEEDRCMYITKYGKMCVAGKNMINPSTELQVSIDEILEEKSQCILKKKSRNILNNQEWFNIQCLHDAIALNNKKLIAKCCDYLGLFTHKELVKYASEYERKRILDNMPKGS